MNRAAVVLLLLAATSLGQDVTPEEAFYSGNRAFKEREYAAAIESYRRALDAGYESAALHFNLGNAYLFSGRHGRALYQFRLAERLAPRDDDIRRNIAVARSRAADKLVRARAPTFVRGLSWFHRRTTAREALTLFCLSWLAGAALLHLRLFWRSAWLTRLGVVLLLAGLVPGSAAAMHALARGTVEEGVILPEEVDVFTGPSDTAYSVYFKLHAGAEVDVEEVRDDWVKIAVDADRKGYVPAPHIGLIPN